MGGWIFFLIIILKPNCNILFAWNSPSVLMINTEQGRRCGCFYVHACASERVCILFMARNQLSLAHNGNVNSPERLSPTQGENWLGAGCVFPNPNTEREFAGLKSCLLLLSLPGAIHSFAHTLLKQVIQTGLTSSQETYSHTYAHTRYAHGWVN